MPAGRDVVSPIGRPREFARALDAMVAKQAGPRGRIALLRNAVEGRMSLWDRRGASRARSVPVTRISRARRRTCGPSRLTKSAWRRSAGRARGQQP